VLETRYPSSFCHGSTLLVMHKVFTLWYSHPCTVTPDVSRCVDWNSQSWVSSHGGAPCYPPASLLLSLWYSTRCS
jgi:hypothetical protein